MPRNVNEVYHIHSMTPEERKKLPSGCQRIWYEICGKRIQGGSILDVGAGDGNGLAILTELGHKTIKGIDPLSINDLVEQTDISEIGDLSWDCVIALDVIEHVEDDINFLSNLFRVARSTVGFSTPNWRCWGCTNPLHVREYTPEEFIALLDETCPATWTRRISLQNMNPYLTPWEVETLQSNENAANFFVWLEKTA